MEREENYHFKQLAIRNAIIRNGGATKKAGSMRKWRVERLILMKRIGNEWLLYTLRNRSANCFKSSEKILENAHREKVSEFKLKRLTTLNYNNVIKKSRLLQCCVYSFSIHSLCSSTCTAEEGRENSRSSRRAGAMSDRTFIHCVYLYFFRYVSTFSQLIELRAHRERHSLVA